MGWAEEVETDEAGDERHTFQRSGQIGGSEHIAAPWKVRAVVIHSAESVRSGCLQKVITRISLSVEWSWSYKPD